MCQDFDSSGRATQDLQHHATAGSHSLRRITGLEGGNGEGHYGLSLVELLSSRGSVEVGKQVCRSSCLDWEVWLCMGTVSQQTVDSLHVM